MRTLCVKMNNTINPITLVGPTSCPTAITAKVNGMGKLSNKAFPRAEGIYARITLCMETEKIKIKSQKPISGKILIILFTGDSSIYCKLNASDISCIVRGQEEGCTGDIPGVPHMFHGHQGMPLPDHLLYISIIS